LLQNCVGNGWASGLRGRVLIALAAGFLFAIIHAPNFPLMVTTFLIGASWSYLFQRYGSVIPLALSHGILGSLFAELSPSFLRMNGVVGLHHFEWLW